MTNNDKTLFQSIYLALLRHSHDSWRVNNQFIYVLVREKLVELTPGSTSQEIQETFESLAIMSNDVE